MLTCIVLSVKKWFWPFVFYSSILRFTGTSLGHRIIYVALRLRVPICVPHFSTSRWPIIQNIFQPAPQYVTCFNPAPRDACHPPPIKCLRMPSTFISVVNWSATVATSVLPGTLNFPQVWIIFRSIIYKFKPRWRWRKTRNAKKTARACARKYTYGVYTKDGRRI